MRREIEKEETKRLQQSYKKSPVMIGSDFYKPAPPSPIIKKPLIRDNIDRIMQTSYRIQDPDKYTDIQFKENTRTIFKGLRTPDFSKVRKIKSGRIDEGIQTYISTMGLRPLREPFKVYKYKTVDQETGEYVITPQTEIQVIAENDNNFYYITNGRMASVAKNETSPTKIDQKQLETIYKSHINEMAKNIRKNEKLSKENATITAANKVSDTKKQMQPKEGEGLFQYIKRSFTELLGDIPATTKKLVSEYVYEVFTGDQSMVGLETELTKLSPENAKKVAAFVSDAAEGYASGSFLQETDNPTVTANVAKLAAFFTPYNPSNYIFKGAGTGLSKLGLKTGGGLVRRSLVSGAHTGAGFGAVEATEEGMSYLTQKKEFTKENLKESGKEVLTSTAFGTGLGILGPVAGAAGKKVLGAIKGTEKAAAAVERISKYNPKFITTYGLDMDISKLSKTEKLALEKAATKRMLKGIGTAIEKKVGSKDPEKVIEYYVKKYELKGDIKIDSTLQGESNFARIEAKNGKIEVRYNKDKDPLEIVGALREEIEHIRDIGKGFIGSEGEVVKNPKTLLDLMIKKGHVSGSDRFEIGYIDNIFKTEMAGTKIAPVAQAVENEAITALKAERVKINQQLKKINTKTKQVELKTRLKEIQKSLAEEQQRIRLGSTVREQEMPIREQEFDPTRNRVMNEATNLPDYNPPKKGMKEKARDFVRRMHNYFIDNQSAISETGVNVKMTAQNYKKYHGTVEAINTRNLVTKLGKKLSDKSLADVLVAPKGFQNEWESYLFAKHHIARMKVGKPVLAVDNKVMSIKRAEELVAQYEKEFPEFQKASSEINQWVDDFSREWLVDGDLISEEAYNTMRQMYPDYVPTYRVTEGEAMFIPGNRISNKVLKAAKGGTEEIVPLSASMPAYVQRIVRAQRRNKIYQQILQNVLDNPEAMQKYAQVVEKMPKSMQAQVESMLSPKEGMEALLNRFDSQIMSAKEGNFLTVLEKGEPITLKINDFALWQGLNKLNKVNMSEEVELLRGFNKYITQNFKNVVTVYNPFFAVKNVFRDVPTGFVQGSIHNPITYTKELFKSAASIMKKDDLYKQFQALGGVTSNATAIEKQMDARKSRKILEVLNYFGSLSETMPRLTEFRYVYNKGLKAGLSETAAIEKALYGSGDVTVNFARGGDITKSLDVLFPYMNAGVQGVDKFFRGVVLEAAKGNFKPVLKALGAVTVPTIVLDIWNNQLNSKAYNDIPNYVRDNNYLLPISDTEYFKVPKNREIAFLFSTLFDKMYQYFVDGNKKALDGTDMLKSFGQSFYNPVEELSRGGLAGPIINIKLGGNKDYFGKNIEPMSMILARKSKRNIYDDTTSLASVKLGPVLESIGLSPKQADYLVKSYAGVLSKFYMAFNGQGETLMERSQKAIKNAAGFTVDTSVTSKSRSEEFNKKDLATQQLSDFEFEKGIEKLRRDLKDQGIKSYNEIDTKIQEFLSPDDYSTWQDLKKKKKELNQ